MSQRKTWRMLADEGILQVRADRQTHRPYGLQGGGPGAFGGMFWTGDADRGETSRQADHDLRRGQVFRHDLPGAGGHGDALSRDLKLVAKDLRDALSRSRRRRGLRVIARGDPPEIDRDATQALRMRLRASRKPLPAVAWEPPHDLADRHRYRRHLH